MTVTTRAVIAAAFGEPRQALSVVEMPVGQPGPGEALLEVRAAGVNPIDYKLYRDPSSYDAAELPARLGFEAAGVVTAVGQQAEDASCAVSVGCEVIAYPIRGAYAAEVVVPVSSVVRKPSALSFEQASGMMLTGTTAAQALAVTRVRSGDTVLVHGASGGVGQMVVQLAVAAGGRVIGTTSESGFALCANLAPSRRNMGPGCLDGSRR